MLKTATQHSPAARDLRRAPDPRKSTGAMVAGVGAFSGSLRGLELVPSKWRCLVPPTSPHHPRQGAPRGCYATGNAHRWAALGHWLDESKRLNYGHFRKYNKASQRRGWPGFVSDAISYPTLVAGIWCFFPL